MSVPKKHVFLTLQGQLLDKPNISVCVPAFTGDSKRQQIFSDDFGLDPQSPQDERLVMPSKAFPSDRPKATVYSFD